MQLAIEGLVFSFKKKKNKIPKKIDSAISESLVFPDLKDRLFFHDVVNQTHGLLLFLMHKEVNKEGLEFEEVQMIEKEIRTLQSLLQDHYNFKHKNLVKTY